MEETFGNKVIPLNHWSESILVGNDELRVYDKFGERVTTYYGNNWGDTPKGKVQLG